MLTLLMQLLFVILLGSGLLICTSSYDRPYYQRRWQGSPYYERELYSRPSYDRYDDQGYIHAWPTPGYEPYRSPYGPFAWYGG